MAIQLTFAKPNHLRHLTFQVCDTGCGIPMMEQARLFQKYSASGQQKGTGLGLFLSQKLVGLMGGIQAPAHPLQHSSVNAAKKNVI